MMQGAKVERMSINARNNVFSVCRLDNSRQFAKKHNKMAGKRQIIYLVVKIQYATTLVPLQVED
jgi:hypothetical protein